MVAGSGPAFSRAHPLGNFRLELVDAGTAHAALHISHLGRADGPEWKSIPGRSFFSAARGREQVEESRGSFFVRDRILDYCRDQTIEAIEASALRIELRGHLRCATTKPPYKLIFQAAGEDQLVFEGRVEDSSLNRTYLTFASRAEERFFGFGEQFTYFDLKGRRVPIFVSEQGIGRGRQPLTWLVDLAADSGGSWHTTYAPAPYYVSSELRSVFLESSELSYFDLTAEDRVRIELFSPSMRGRILHGASPLGLLREYTDHAGRMRPLPKWVHAGAIVGVQGGTARVRAVLDRLSALETPIAAFWLQDWVGQRTTSFGKQLWWNWELDRDRYPEWEELVSELAARGIRVMTYVNPFLVELGEEKRHRRNLFREAKERGFLVRNPDGDPYMLRITSFSAALVDLTNPAARRWMVDVIRDNVIDAGASGWMADFGEALPYDAVLFDGEPAAVHHNRYPEEWAAVNRQAAEETGRDDLVFFSRSGFTRSPGMSTLFWLGDQLVSWDEHDGIKSSVTGLLSGGMSGFAFNHSDIGGYTTIARPFVRHTRSKELLLRWIELAAFQVVFRTHEGNLPEANQQLDSDPELLRHFARFAKVHAAWAFYRDELIREASETGAPVVRHLFLHHPGERWTWRLRYEQFLVGSELLVAPVLDPNRDEVQVHLPAGKWIHLWSGTAHGDQSSAVQLTIAAPLGEPAVFYREGSAVGERFRSNLGALRETP